MAGMQENNNKAKSDDRRRNASHSALAARAVLWYGDVKLFLDYARRPWWIPAGPLTSPSVQKHF